MKHENILLKSALALAIVDLVLIAATLLQVNGFVKDVIELQNKQLEIEGMKEKQNFAAPGVDVDFDEGQWQTYKNEEFGFEIKYPKAWKVNQIGSPYLDLAKNQLALFAIEDPASPLRNLSPKFCSIAIYENKNNLSLKDWIDETDIYTIQGDGLKINKSELYILSNGTEGQKIYSAGGNLTGINSIFIPFNNKIYHINYFTQFETDKVSAILKNKDICERIASTYFKFTN